MAMNLGRFPTCSVAIVFVGTVPGRRTGLEFLRGLTDELGGSARLSSLTSEGEGRSPDVLEV